jgi:ribosomal protein S18 acetylase RimI-like enzyme
MIEIIEISPERLSEYNTVPSRFLVRTMLDLEPVDNGLGGMLMREVPVEPPYIKDYDSYGELPTDWPRIFDVRKWGFLLAVDGIRPVGAAAIAFDTTGVFMLEARRDLSVLWDIRVAPEAQGHGAGRLLFEYAGLWSRARGCTQMKIETQNVNVPACRFYHSIGCTLGEIRRFGYAAVSEVAHEVMLCWYFDLISSQAQKV